MRWLILLRSINVGGANRLEMARLRAVLSEPGVAIDGHRLGDVRTHLQSGNVVVDWDGSDEGRLAAGVGGVIAERFGLDVGVIVRSCEELATVVAGNPFTEQAASDPKRLQVTFTSAPLATERLDKLRSLCGPDELLAVGDRVVYSWHPNGIARSKLGLALPKSSAASIASSRNWLTVLKCDEMLRVASYARPVVSSER